MKTASSPAKGEELPLLSSTLAVLVRFSWSYSDGLKTGCSQLLLQPIRMCVTETFCRKNVNMTSTHIDHAIRNCKKTQKKL